MTLRLAAPAQAEFEALRRAHFPTARNLIPAHATLFHALPGDAEDEVCDALAASGASSFAVTVAGLRLLGRGVAFKLRSDELLRRRAAIAARLAGGLTRQDSARYDPHITIQNKVTPEQARALHAELAAGFAPWTAQAAAFELWRYLGGPWAPVATHALGSFAQLPPAS